jgi:hypothetical protein
MFRERDGRTKRRRAAAIAIEPLEDRVVLTAAVAHLEIQYLRAINHLNGLLQRRVNQVQTMLARRSARIDAQYEGALDRSAQRMGGGPAQAREAQVAPSRSTAAADSRISQVVTDVDRQLGGLTATFNRRLADVTGHFGQLNRTIRGANPYFQAFFRNALAAVDGGIAGEAQAAQGALQAASGPLESAAAQAGTSGASAQAHAQAASSQLAATGEAQRAADRAAVARFWDEYYSSFNPLRAEMAAIASAQLPPVHLGGGRVTGPQGPRTGNNRGINGTGTGTITGTPGAVGTGTNLLDTGTTGTGVGTQGSAATGTTTTGLTTGTTGTGLIGTFGGFGSTGTFGSTGGLGTTIGTVVGTTGLGATGLPTTTGTTGVGLVPGIV